MTISLMIIRKMLRNLRERAVFSLWFERWTHRVGDAVEDEARPSKALTGIGAVSAPICAPAELSKNR